MITKNSWLRSLSVILIVALLLGITGSLVSLGPDSAHSISGSFNASSYEGGDNQNPDLTETNDDSEAGLDESQDLDEEPGEPSEVLNLFKDFEPDSTDGKIDVIIGFTGATARGAQHQERMIQRTELIKGFGGDVARGFTIINAVNVRLPMQAIETLSKLHEVSYIEPNYKVSLISQNVPWGVDRAFGPEKYIFATWSASRGKGVAVAVLDTGIDENHVDLPNLLGGTNTIDSTHWGSDVSGHGTHVAGAIVALDNDQGVVGIAPSAGLYSVKVIDDSGYGTYASVIAGIEWAYNMNIPVINMSLGGGFHAKSLKDAVDAAYAGGVLLVAAAGNDGDSSDNVLYPARYDSVIAVSASDSNNKLASFSSRGPSIELIAPGVSIQSTYPGNYYATWSGTSMASPHVSGSAAMLWGANNSLNNKEVRQIMINSAQDLGLPDNQQGYGLIRADLAVALAATLNPLPPKVTLISPRMAESVSGEMVQFRWNVAEGATKYQLQIRYADDHSIYRNPILGDQTQRFIGGFPEDGTRFRWRVRAGNEADWGEWSDFRNFVNEAVEEPVPPKVILISPRMAESVSGEMVQFRWNVAEGATKYQLQIRYADDHSIYRNPILGDQTQRFIGGFPEDGTRFRWRVRAGNEADWGEWSDFRNFGSY